MVRIIDCYNKKNQAVAASFPLPLAPLLFYYNAQQVNGLSDVHLGNHPFSGSSTLVSGVVGNAALKDSNIVLNSPTNLGFDSFPFSFTTWNKKAIPTAQHNLLSHDTTNYAGVKISLQPNGDVIIQYGDGTGIAKEDRKTFTGTLPVNDDQFHLYTFNFIDINTIEGFQDTVPFTLTYASGTATTVDFNTGYNMNSDNPMTIDETFGYKAALTQAQHNLIYNNGNGVTL